MKEGQLGQQNKTLLHPIDNREWGDPPRVATLCIVSQLLYAMRMDYEGERWNGQENVMLSSTTDWNVPIEVNGIQ